MMVLPKLQQTDESLFEAAQDLGCSPIKSLFKVIIPSLQTAIMTGALLAFTLSIDDFVISYFTQGNGFYNFLIMFIIHILRKISRLVLMRIMPYLQ